MFILLYKYFVIVLLFVDFTKDFYRALFLLILIYKYILSEYNVVCSDRHRIKYYQI